MEDNIKEEAFYILHQGFLDCIGDLPDNEPISSEFTRIKINEDMIPVVIFNFYQEKIEEGEEDNPFSYNKKLKIFFDDRENIFSVFLDGKEEYIFSSEFFPECFDFCHSIQKKSVILFLEGWINDYFNNNETSCYSFSEFYLLISKMIKLSHNNKFISSYSRFIMSNIESMYKNIVAKREREILLNSIKLESNISEARKKRI